MSYKRTLMRWNPETRSMDTVYEDELREVHYVQGDEIAPTVHPVDGKIYTSKSAIRRVTAAAGLIEAGNENIRAMKPEDKEIPSERIADAFKHARDYLRDPRNLREYREREREKRGFLREVGLADD